MELHVQPTGSGDLGARINGQGSSVHESRLIAAGVGIAVIAGSAAVATGQTSTPNAADRSGTPIARSAAIRISDIDADLKRGGKLRLEAEARGATRLTFTYRGRTAPAGWS